MSERNDRGRFVLRDPAMAVAAAKCVVARDLGASTMGTIAPRFFHPGECSYCEMEPEFLRAAVAEFNEWAGLNPPPVYDPGDPMMHRLEVGVESFILLPREEQAIRVARAQGYR